LRRRSLIFVPADNPELIGKARAAGADGVILDLEDGVAPGRKAAARDELGRHVGQLKAAGVDVSVRVNRGASAAPDIAAAVAAGAAAIVLPKVEAASDVAETAGHISQVEAERGLVRDRVAIVALVESPAALFELRSIAAAPRVTALALGGEDLAASLRVPPSPHALTLPCQMIALAAAAVACEAFGLPGSLADFRALAAFEDAAIVARAIGLTGSLCIHPAQVAIVNRVFAPTTAEAAWAEAVLEAWARGEQDGDGIVVLDGMMIDRPVAERARAIRAFGRG
jgi:citrate lyase subunit beta/citryl-CoA lyase